MGKIGRLERMFGENAHIGSIYLMGLYRWGCDRAGVFLHFCLVSKLQIGLSSEIYFLIIPIVMEVSGVGPRNVVVLSEARRGKNLSTWLVWVFLTGLVVLAFLNPRVSARVFERVDRSINSSEVGSLGILSQASYLLTPFGSHTSLRQYNFREVTEGQAARVLSHSSYMRRESYREIFTGKVYEGDFFHVVGEVQNVATENIEVEIVPVFYDEGGTVIEAEPLHGSVKPLEILAPGQKSPFEMMILDEVASRKVVDYELLVESTVTTKEPCKLGFPNHSSYVSIIDIFEVVGEVENMGAENVERVKILATFYNETGTVIGADFCYAEIDTLVSGQKSPFGVSNYPRKEITGNVRSYGLCARGEKTAKAPYRELEVVTHVPEIDRSGYYKITGRVENVGEIDATFVKVVATFYDSQGRIVGYDSSYPVPLDLKTGETGSFQVAVSDKELSTKVVSYGLVVECSEYRSIYPSTTTTQTATIPTTTAPTTTVTTPTTTPPTTTPTTTATPSTSITTRTPTSTSTTTTAERSSTGPPPLAPEASFVMQIVGLAVAVVTPVSVWLFSRRRRSRLRFLMRNIESTFTKFRSDVSKCEVALLLIKEEAQRDLEEGRITAEQFALIDKRLQEYLKELRNLMGNKQ